MIIDSTPRFIAEELKPLEDGIGESVSPDRATARAIHEKSKFPGLHALKIPAEPGGVWLSVLGRMLCQEQFGHSTDCLIRCAFGNTLKQWHGVAAHSRPCLGQLLGPVA